MNTLKHWFFAFLGFCLLAAQDTGWAAIQKSAEQQNTVAEVTAFPIDVLQQRLVKKERSKAARNLKLAFDSLEKQNFSRALQLGSLARKDPLFFDFGSWMMASANLGQAKALLRKKKFKESIKNIEAAQVLSLQIERNSPYSPVLRFLPKDLAEEDLLYGLAHAGLKNWKKSEEYFEKSFQRLNSMNQLSAVDFDAAKAYVETCKKGRGLLCVSWTRKFSVIFPNKFEEVKPIKNSYPRISKLLSVPYKAPDPDVTAFDAAFQLYRDEKYKKAIEGFKDFLRDYPLSTHRNRARYWLARCLLLRKDPEEAQKYLDLLRQESPLSYYGLLALSSNSDNSSNGKKLSLPTISSELPVATDTDPALTPSEQYHLLRAKKLVAEQAYPLAALELKEFKMREELSVPFLVYFAMLNSKAKNHISCFQTLQELTYRGYTGILSTFGLGLFFPAEFLELIKKYSAANELDPILVLSLIKQESGFLQDANSSVGALGLMQLMPATAVEVEKNVDLTELVKAEQNIKVGTKYLRKLLTQFKGNAVYALAAYNAGPTATQKWIKKTAGGKQDLQEFIELISYRETREYVGSIIRNYFWYSRQLNGGPMENLDVFWKKDTQ